MRFPQLLSLCLLFVATLTMTPQALAMKEVDPALVQEAVTRLKEIGVVSDPAYWIENAKKGQTCEGGQVSELLIAGAKKFGPVDNAEAAVKTLMENNVIQNKKSDLFWSKAAVSGCPGNFVATLLVQMADVLK